MRRAWGVIVCVLVTLASLQAQTPSGTQPLQGRWTMMGEAFEIRTASGNMLRGTLRVDTSKSPLQMDLRHADGARWEAIYEVNGDAFRLNDAEAGGKDQRPDTFTTGNGTERSIVAMRREPR